ncbi:MAG TPA: glycosyltransferase 87 family protein [Miltoncostaeaceae bacterium]|nr:glycosyltransferase 87 family protein [Miltoncostaeaceae bacterium]
MLRPPARAPRAGLPAAAGVVLATVLWVAQYRAWWELELGDLPVYERTFRLIALGELPYADFRLEYPPLAAVLFWVAGVLPGGYALGFSALMLVCLAVTVVATAGSARALGLGPRAEWAGALVAGASPALLGPLVQTRYDLAVAALLALVVRALVAGRWRTVWVLLGVATLLKLVPLVLAPLVLVAHARARGWPTAARDAALAVGVVAAGLAPAVAASPRGAWQVVAYHLERPLQIESLGAAVLLTLHHAAGTGLQHVTSYGSDNLTGTLPDALATLGSLLSVAVLVLATRAAARRPRGDALAEARATVAVLAATLTALVALGKVLSPQYLLWLVPLVSLAGPRRGPRAALVLAVAMVLSAEVFPERYRALTEEFALTPVVLLGVRDLLLVALAVLVWPVRRNTLTPSSWKTRRMSGRARSAASVAARSPSSALMVVSGRRRSTTTHSASRTTGNV